MGNAGGHPTFSSLSARGRSAGLQDSGIKVQSSRALGVFALAAVILAAISFAAVDVTLSASAPDTLPAAALAYALIGTLSLMVSVVPAVLWFTRFLEHPHHEADIEPLPLTVTARTFEDDDL